MKAKLVLSLQGREQMRCLNLSSRCGRISRKANATALPKQKNLRRCCTCQMHRWRRGGARGEDCEGNGSSRGRKPKEEEEEACRVGFGYLNGIEKQEME
jgi:hypothetical protein